MSVYNNNVIYNLGTISSSEFKINNSDTQVLFAKQLEIKGFGKNNDNRELSDKVFEFTFDDNDVLYMPLYKLYRTVKIKSLENNKLVVEHSPNGQFFTEYSAQAPENANRLALCFGMDINICFLRFYINDLINYIPLTDLDENNLSISKDPIYCLISELPIDFSIDVYYTSSNVLNFDDKILSNKSYKLSIDSTDSSKTKLDDK